MHLWEIKFTQLYVSHSSITLKIAHYRTLKKCETVLSIWELIVQKLMLEICGVVVRIFEVLGKLQYLWKYTYKKIALYIFSLVQKFGLVMLQIVMWWWINYSLLLYTVCSSKLIMLLCVQAHLGLIQMCLTLGEVRCHVTRFRLIIASLDLVSLHKTTNGDVQYT